MMKQSVLAILVSILVGVLILLNYAPPVFSQAILDLSEVSGIDVYHKGIPYTLNLAQQNTLGDLLNNSLNVVTPPPLEPNTIAVEKVIIYLLQDQKSVVLIPKGENKIHFAYFLLDGKWYKEPQPGKLKQLLETTYDQ